MPGYWQAQLDDQNRVVNVNNWEHEVGVPCEPGQPVGWLWTGTEFVMPPELLISAVSEAVQTHLDETAKLYGFDSIFTASTYVGSPVARFNTHGSALRDWRDLCWAHCYQVLDDVQAGRRALPSVNELLAELPQLAMP